MSLRFERRFSGSAGRSGASAGEWKNMPTAPSVRAASGLTGTGNPDRRRIAA
jgi:hypothetical protein